MDGIIKKIFEIIVAIILAVLTGILVLQVFCRFILNNSLGWTDELSGFLLVWLTFFGSFLALVDREHISFTLVVEKAKGNWSLLLRLFADLVVLVLLMVFFYYSLPLISRTWHQTAVTFPIPKGVIYLAIPITCLVHVIYLIIRMSSYLMPRITKKYVNYFKDIT